MREDPPLPTFALSAAVLACVWAVSLHSPVALHRHGSRLFSADIPGTLDGCPAAVGMPNTLNRTAAAGSVPGTVVEVGVSLAAG